MKARAPTCRWPPRWSQGSPLCPPETVQGRFWGKLRRATEAARAQDLSTRYAREVVTLSITALTTQTYFSLRSLDAQIASTRATLASRDETLSIVRRRAEGGLASDLDVRQAEGAP